MEIVSLEINRDAAVVLFEWLSRFKETGHSTFLDQAEQRALWDLEADLESRLTEPFSADYDSRLAAARETIRDAVD
jgi:hypothetical protein